MKSNLFTIRKFKPGDAEGTSIVIQKTLLESNGEDYSISILKPLHDYFTPEKVTLLAEERHTLVAEIEDIIVGTAALEEDHIQTFFILPLFQKKGIGRKLLSAIEEAFLITEYNTLRVNASVTGASFYEKMGFKRQGSYTSEHAGLQFKMEKVIK